ncbi:hypothetical protein U1Q18_013718 [Sarracenia purpurea var. burkii]
MAIPRARRDLSSGTQEPPPSPIPTGKGSRSAADSIFSAHLNRSLKIPELSLPDYVHRSVPADIDRRSLLSREGDSVKRVLRSAAEFGVFRISGHGICVDELRSTLVGADTVFGISDDGETECCRDSGGCDEFAWLHSEEGVAERAQKVIGAEKYRSFSQMMENVANELEAIAGELAEVVSESANKQLLCKQIQPRKSILSLHRYDHNAIGGDSPLLSNERQRESCYEHALTLHLLFDQFEFHVQSEQGPLSFTASPDTIVVTVGKQLEEWSLGEFKSAFGVLTFEPNLGNVGASFSIELNCSPSNFSHGPGKINRVITLSDQIVFMAIIALLYNVFLFIFF